MVARLGGAICVAAIMFACSSYSVSSNGSEKEITRKPVESGPGIVGVNIETVSGERYDPTTWKCCP